MQVAIYLEDGVTQIVLTAEGKWEEGVLAQLAGQNVTVLRGGFYECQGGWFRQRRIYESPYGDTEIASVMLRVNRSTDMPAVDMPGRGMP